MERLFIVVGSLLGGLGVGAGAFAAHGLKSRLTPEMLAVFETAARYQLIHALALVGVGLVLVRMPGHAVSLAGWCFVFGVMVFSGSLYMLTLTGARWLGMITPIGGLAMIVGWLSLAWGVYSSR